MDAGRPLIPALICGAAAVLPGGTAAAAILDCRLYLDCPAGVTCRAAPLDLRFALDRSQFLRPRIGNEPPPRLRTFVRAGPDTYPAEPILMADGTRGFHARLDDREQLLTIAPDGAAIFTDTAETARRTGTCREISE